MTADKFAYWLQGFAELNAEPPNAEQWESICAHLGLVFTKVTPAVRSGPPLGQVIPYQGAPNTPNWTDLNARAIC